MSYWGIFVSDKNIEFMGIKKIRENLHLKIEQADEKLIRLMYALSLAYDIPEETNKGIPSSDSWNSISHEKLLEEIKTANKDIEAGNFTSFEDLEKEMEQW